MGSTIILIIVFIIIVAVIFFLLMKENKKIKSKGKSVVKFDEPRVIQRFSKLRKGWYAIKADNTFLTFAKNLMDINSMNGDSKEGVYEIYSAYLAIDQYFKTKLQILPNVRVTLIYSDGIVFYDSAVDISRIYFMDKNGLPKPVSLSTLGSPLKDHNTVPEVMMSISNVYYPDAPAPFIYLGLDITHPFYDILFKEGFGFFERKSSSLNVPYSYVARFMPFLPDPATGFTDGFTLRISIPIQEEK